jgi:hypothetical protein
MAVAAKLMMTITQQRPVSADDPVACPQLLLTSLYPDTIHIFTEQTNAPPV